MKFVKREGKHIIVGFKAEELDLIGGTLKLASKNMLQSVETTRVRSMARNMVTDIYKIISRDSYWKKKVAKGLREDIEKEFRCGDGTGENGKRTYSHSVNCVCEQEKKPDDFEPCFCGKCRTGRTQPGEHTNNENH